MMKHKVSKIFGCIIILFFLSFEFSCKNTSMEAMVKDYNTNFIPSYEVYWLLENGLYQNLVFDKYSLQDEYKMSKDTGLFIISGPVDCDSYVWRLNGAEKSREVILKLSIKKQKQNINGSWDYSGSLPIGTYVLLLKCKKGSNEKEWKTKLVIE